ncbi:glycogen debranching N-terminal domain-containing protein [Cellulomonas fimi]|uniref:Amylo-alpha-1,6-glucosidase n=1 Tax=Cellulomonas fimi TaxID=1708 RepID=A0A7Y0LWW0_CELFI|nr:glycogen debranching N-terminal domain-containing protein [Cellulomonas fimi]NMR19404.1 amylo-alpha-1,6-glucosidase [Cellulomonas fimi]
MELQPFLHDLLVATMAPTQAWSAPDGQVRPGGAQGWYHGDVRVLSQALLTVDGREPDAIAGGPAGPGAVEVVALLRGLAEDGADPRIELRRTREVRPGQVREQLRLVAATSHPVSCTVGLELACDLASMDHVKQGRATAARAAWGGDGKAGSSLSAPGGPTWTDDAGTRVALDAGSARVVDAATAAPRLRWDVALEPGVPLVLEWGVSVEAPAGVVGPPATAEPEWSVPTVESDDRRLPALLDRALADLSTLRMTADFAPGDTFLAAGAPWFFTLFGRDSIWAARMLLPLGTDLAAGTLRVLAARQGTVVDRETAEEPGKILHEVRSRPLSLGEGDRVLPPLYYGTVDATPLWVCLLHDAWRWGLPADQVEALLPAMERALAWMTDHGDADGDGFLEYVDATGRGLANQGWKDSGDSVQWRDGTLATGPIALCEVQAYAHEAALGGAALLDAFGRPGAGRWRSWAAALAERFRARFWVEDASGPYPAIALDAAKRPVDSLTSNIGHLLGTGLLDAREERLVAERLRGPGMSSGFGLRTLATTSGGYWPLRYHGGSVWAHDTAIAVLGLTRSGHVDAAAVLVDGLLAAGDATGYRLPELYSGDERSTVPTLVPYPAACRPQAWSAAAAVAVLGAALGLAPDVPRGELRVAPVTPSPVGAIRVTGLALGGRPLGVAVDASGSVVEVSAEVDVRVLRGPCAD